MSRPGEASPLSIECVTCDGRSRDCPDCGGAGALELTGCPRDFAAGVWDAITAADRFRLGRTPAAGGDGDQTEHALAVIQYIHAEEADHEREAIEDMKRKLRQ